MSDKPLTEKECADVLKLVKRYGDARAGKALHNGEAQQASCDVALSAVQDAIADLRAELASFKRAHAAAHECAGDMQALATEMGLPWGECVWKAVPLLRAKLAEAGADARALREALDGIAERDCEFGDDCPAFGSRHYPCDPCRARSALALRGKEAPRG